MNARILSGLILTGALCAACAQPARRPERAVDDALDAGAGGESSSSWEGGKLYARDGSVVGAAPAPQDAAGVAPRELAPSEGGRMYILERYQKVIDERDALELETRSLQAELDGARASLAGTDRESAALQAQIAQLTAENKRLLDENVELAARLTTAQIRRLQVEKILLESRVEELRAAQAASQSTAKAEAAKN